MDDYTDLIMLCPFHGITLEESFPNSVYYQCSECVREFRLEQLQAMANYVLKYAVSNIQYHQCGSNDWHCLDECTDEGEGRANGDKLDDEVWRVIGYLGCNKCGASWLV